MKTLYAIITAVLVSTTLIPQEFEWATPLNITNSNEVAGMDVAENGNVYLTGVLSADASLPYNGDSYVIKTDADGNELWTKYIGSNVFFGDVVCVGNDVVIMGQSTDAIQCNGAVFAPSVGLSHMFMIRIDEDGTILWTNQYEDRHGQFSNLDYHNGVIALQGRGQFNSGTHIMHFDTDGNIINQREFTSFDAVEIAYYNGQTYLSCSADFGDSFFVDDVEIEQPIQESPTFVLALDSELEATWAHSTSAINNTDGVITANEFGVYSYQSVLTDNFQFTSELWKFNFEGDLINAVNPPVFTNAVSLYPDIAVSDCHVVLFAQNNFEFTNHEVTIFDHDLNVIDEKQIEGNSNLYSGQVATHNNQIYVAHVHTDDLNFNDETEIIDLLDDAFQFPYLAKIAVAENCGTVNGGDCSISNIFIEELECEDGEYYVDFEFDYVNVSDSFTVVGNGMIYGTFAYGEPFYTAGPFAGDGGTMYELIVKDLADVSCLDIIEFEAQLCPVGDCAVEDLEVYDIVCAPDSLTYSFTFNAEFIDATSGSFDVWINDTFYGFQSFDDLPITTTSITPSDTGYDVIKICVNDNPDCCQTLWYQLPECLDGVGCEVTDLEVYDFECESDTTYAMKVNSNYSGSSSYFFDLWVNNDLVESYPWSELPVTIGGIVPRDAEQDIVKVCETNNPECCDVLEYDRPDCLIDQISEELVSISIYPNPAEDLVKVESSSGVQLRLIILDSSGREVSKASIERSGQLDVSHLSSGIYHVEVFEGEVKLMTQKLYKL